MFNIGEAIIAFIQSVIVVSIAQFIINLLKFNYDNAEVYFKIISVGVIVLTLSIMVNS